MRRPVRAALAALFLLALASPSVFAHSELETAEPGDDAVVVGSPTELVTTWTQDLDPSRTSLDVRAPDGSRVVRGGTIDPADPRRMTLALPELAPGTYEVRWTSFSSEDDELARGRYRFTVEAEPSPTATVQPSATAEPASTPSATSTATATPGPSAVVASPAPEPPPADESGAAVVVPIVVAALVVLGVAAWILKRR